MNNDTIPYSSRSIRDGNASGGFLSKASSSLKRSPSKKHRRQSSNPLPSLEKVFYETQKSQVSEHNPHPQKRPDAHRNQTAPLSIQTTKLSLKEGKAPQSAVEAMMVVTPFTTTHRRDTGNSLNKLQAAIPTNSDYISAAVNKGGVPLPATLASASGIQTPSVLYQHIHEMANKRISTLDYFRKAYA